MTTTPKQSPDQVGAGQLVRWALRDERVGLYGLLAAALRANPTNLDLLAPQVHWKGVVPHLGSGHRRPSRRGETVDPA